MDFEKLKVDVTLEEEPYNEVREKWLNDNPDKKAKEEEEEKLLIEDAKKQIADYIKSFKRLPNKKVWFSNDWYDDYHVLYLSIKPMSNKVYCNIGF